MKNLDLIGEELFSKIRGRFPAVKIGNEAGEVVNDPKQARFFDFDFLADKDNNLGKVSVSISEDDGLTVIYSNEFIANEDSLTQQKWYDFLKELRFFAKKRLLNFDTRNITKSNLDKRDYKFLAQTRAGDEQMNESKLYGTSQTSYQDMDGARLVIKHTKPVNPEMAAGRTQHVGRIYIESAEGERFKYPYKHLNGARAMARHVAEGGKPYDDFGNHIVGLSEEMAKLRKFKNYMGRSAVMAESLAGYMDIVKERISTVKKTVENLQKAKYYREAVGGFEAPVFEEVPEDVAENWIDELTIRQFNEELKDVFPYIYKLVGEATRAEELGPEELDEAFVVDYRDPEGRFKVVYEYDKKVYIAVGNDEYKKSIEPQRFEKLDHAIEHAEEELEGEAVFDDENMEEYEKKKGVDGKACWKGYRYAGKEKKADGTYKDKCVKVEDQYEEALDDLLGQFAEGFDTEEFEGELDYEGVGDDGETSDCVLSYRAKVINGKPVVDPKSFHLSCAMNPMSGLGFDDDFDLANQDPDALMAAAQEDADHQWASRDNNDAQGEDDDDKSGTKEQKTPLSEFILSYFDYTSGQFPKGETAVLTMVEKDYGDEYIEPAKQFIEKINNRVAEVMGYRDTDFDEGIKSSGKGADAWYTKERALELAAADGLDPKRLSYGDLQDYIEKAKQEKSESADILKLAGLR